MYLTGSKYIEPEIAKPKVSTQKRNAIKTRIKALVPKTSDKRMSDKEIIKILTDEYIAKNEHIHDSVFKDCFVEVYNEYNPTPEEEVTPIE